MLLLLLAWHCGNLLGSVLDLLYMIFMLKVKQCWF